MNTEERAALGKRIKDFRLEAGMSRAKLASAIGCGASRILPWEKGESRPNPIGAVKLSQVMKCTITYIYPEWNELSHMERIMAQRGFSAEKLAETVGTHRNNILRIKAGKQSPSIEMVNRIAKALRCAAEDLHLRATRRTPKREWQKDSLTEEQRIFRNELFARNKKIIDSVIYNRRAMIRACRVDVQDARQTVAERMCSALEKLILTDNSANTALNYLTVSLDHELVSYCLKEKVRGMTEVPKGSELSVLSLDSLISDGFQI